MRIPEADLVARLRLARCVYTRELGSFAASVNGPNSLQLNRPRCRRTDAREGSPGDSVLWKSSCPTPGPVVRLWWTKATLDAEGGCRYVDFVLQSCLQLAISVVFVRRLLGTHTPIRQGMSIA